MLPPRSLSTHTQTHHTRRHISLALSCAQSLFRSLATHLSLSFAVSRSLSFASTLSPFRTRDTSLALSISPSRSLALSLARSLARSLSLSRRHICSTLRLNESVVLKIKHNRHHKFSVECTYASLQYRSCIVIFEQAKNSFPS
jgi:hypothetical protein